MGWRTETGTGTITSVSSSASTAVTANWQLVTFTAAYVSSSTEITVTAYIDG